MQQQIFYSVSVNDSNLWFLYLTPTPSGQCPYYFTFSFRSISIRVNITVQENYTLEVTVLGNAYQLLQVVYSVSQPSEGMISSNPIYSMWGVCITISHDSSVALQFPCISAYKPTFSFFILNVSIPLVEQNAPVPTLSVIPGANVSDVNLLAFSSSWSLSGLCGWFFTLDTLQFFQ